MNSGDADREVVAEDPQRCEVGHDAGLVVSRPTRIETVAALGRLERRRVPLGVVVLGLHVVVGVEQHGRRTLRTGLVRDDGRGAAVDAHDLGLAALGLEQRPHRLGAALHLGCACRVGTDRLDPHQVLEVGADTGQDLRDLHTQLLSHVTTLAGSDGGAPGVGREVEQGPRPSLRGRDGRVETRADYGAVGCHLLAVVVLPTAPVFGLHRGRQGFPAALRALDCPASGRDWRLSGRRRRVVQMGLGCGS